MSKPHVFNILTEICENCGISGQEMAASQAMDDCPGMKYGIDELMIDYQKGIVKIYNEPTPLAKFPENDKPIHYLKARVNEKTMEVEVADRGIWIPLHCHPAYRRQRELAEEEFMPSAREIKSGMLWKSGVEMPKDSKRFYERLGDLGVKKTEPEEPLKNYCAPNEMFSRCKAGKTWKGHVKCRFAEKASFEERCMYFHTDGTKHCDNPKAQKALYLSASDGRLVPNE